MAFPTMSMGSILRSKTNKKKINKTTRGETQNADLRKKNKKERKEKKEHTERIEGGTKSQLIKEDDEDDVKNKVVVVNM